MNESIKSLLSGHTSPATAYVVADYPYGFRLRCQMRYWLEHNPKRGTRLWSQTTNPKRPGTVWNKPKASTYADIAGCMYLNAEGHVTWSQLNIYSDAPEIASWLAQFGAGLDAPALAKANAWLADKQVFAEARAVGYPSNVAALVVHLINTKGKTVAEAYTQADELVAKIAAATAAAQAAAAAALKPAEVHDICDNCHHDYTVPTAGKDGLCPACANKI